MSRWTPARHPLGRPRPPPSPGGGRPSAREASSTGPQRISRLRRLGSGPHWPEASDFVARFCTLRESNNTRPCENRVRFESGRETKAGDGRRTKAGERRRRAVEARLDGAAFLTRIRPNRAPGALSCRPAFYRPGGRSTDCSCRHFSWLRSAGRSVAGAAGARYCLQLTRSGLRRARKHPRRPGPARPGDGRSHRPRAQPPPLSARGGGMRAQ